VTSDLERLSDIGSAPFALDPPGEETPLELRSLLNIKNGFWAFESALEVFPSTTTVSCYGLKEWNESTLWLKEYGDLAPQGVCFAQDVLGGQFVYSDAVYSFDPETGSVDCVAKKLNEWASALLGDYHVLTGYDLAHQWQSLHGPIPPRHRLVPIVPFVLGGDFSVGNLVLMESVKAMRLRASLALQIRNLPDGAQVEYRVVD
jgi:hypothetical protein